SASDRRPADAESRCLARLRLLDCAHRGALGLARDDESFDVLRLALATEHDRCDDCEDADRDDAEREQYRQLPARALLPDRQHPPAVSRNRLQREESDERVSLVEDAHDRRVTEVAATRAVEAGCGSGGGGAQSPASLLPPQRGGGGG